jgi:hypothetical protein
VRILPILVDNEGKRWGSLEAIKNGKEALIHERIFDKEKIGVMSQHGIGLHG